MDEGIADLDHCGWDHMRCCRQRVRGSLVEAVYLAYKINTQLDREKRKELIHRSLQLYASREVTQAAKAPLDQTYVCPLSQSQKCLLFSSRPLACRLYDSPDMSPHAHHELHEAVFAVSRSLFLAFGGSFFEQDIKFDLTRVVSGKYVQDFFAILLQKA